MKMIIVYYSLGGFTKSVAEQLAAQTGADLLALHPVKQYPDTGAKKFLVGGRAALAGEKPKLQPYTFDAKRYDKVLLATPVWASSPAPPLRTFLNDRRDEIADKVCGAFFTQLGSGSEKAAKKLAAALGTERLPLTETFFEPNKKDAHPENGQKLADFAEKLRA